MSAALIRNLTHARERLQAGDAAGAQSLCQEVLQHTPRNPDALYLLGVTHLMTGHARAALPPLQQAVVVEPRHGAALENLGLAHLMLGDFGAAERVLRDAAGLPGAPASVFMRLGAAIINQGRYGEAVADLQHALQLEPHNPDIHLNLGQALAGMGEHGDAREQFEAALRLAPDHGDAMYNLGVICLEREQLDEARLWFERVIAQLPQRADAHVNLGIVHEKQQRLDAALACFKRALAIDPALAQARNNLARACALQGLLAEAREHYLAALRLDPNLAEAHEGLASACLALGSLPGHGALLQEAEAAAERAKTLDPAAAGAYGVLADLYALRGARESAVGLLEEGYERTGASDLLAALALQLRYLCDWDKWSRAWEKISPLLDASPPLGAPFSLICQPTNAAQQLVYARRWSHAQFGNIASTPATPARSAHAGRRRRVGYLSSDFRQHAISDLLVEVLELHDRNRFEIFAYSHGADDGSAMRARLKQSCEHFVDIADHTDELAARRIRDDELDILIDLNGHIRGARTAILARRPCAIQVSWIGYPGTMGASFIDYLIADSFVVPPEHECFYAERVLRLPHCYLPSDRRREIAATLPRAEYGLPADAFVFCCFNQVYKITPDVFACWMRVLRKIPGSVLWLPDDNHTATENLKKAAGAFGVAPARVVIAGRVPLPAQHLARYRVADLALDTFPYTSHTTASDALWAGCPLVGLCGTTFAARVSGSILTACNLSELVAYSLDDYECLAYRLATDGAFNKEMRARLAAAKTSAPLFDSAAFTTDLERLYTDIVA